MGSHTEGNAMGRAAQAAVKNRQPGQTALEILDEICMPYRNLDAEFEAEDPNHRGQVHPDFNSWTDPHPGAGLGMLMVEAFAPNGLADLPKYAAMMGGPDTDEAAEAEEAACDLYEAEVHGPFSKRYAFY